MRKVRITYTASATVEMDLSSYPGMTEKGIKEYEEGNGEAEVFEVLAGQDDLDVKVEVEFFDE